NSGTDSRCMILVKAYCHLLVPVRFLALEYCTTKQLQILQGGCCWYTPISFGVHHCPKSSKDMTFLVMLSTNRYFFLRKKKLLFWKSCTTLNLNTTIILISIARAS